MVVAQSSVDAMWMQSTGHKRRGPHQGQSLMLLYATTKLNSLSLSLSLSLWCQFVVFTNLFKACKQTETPAKKDRVVS